MSRSSRGRGAQAQGGHGRDSHLDALNMSMTEGLAGKLGQLKGFALGLEEEAKEHLGLLDGVEDDMEGGVLRMGGSAGRLRSMGRTRGMSGRRLSCWVALGLIAFLLLFYYVLLPLTTRA